MRLQKYLAECGIGSRRKCEEHILGGRVNVNGKRASLGMSLAEGDRVTFDGRPVIYGGRRYILFYKPSRVMCTASDPEGRETVHDYVKTGERLFTIGRLDYISEGALLLTNDGAFANALTHPSRRVEKTYLVRCEGEVTRDDIDALEKGIALEDGMTAKARAKLLSVSPKGSAVLLTIREGRNRQVRRMFAALGRNVLFLKRVSFAGIALDGLKKGEWRDLTAEELQKIR